MKAALVSFALGENSSAVARNEASIISLNNEFSSIVNSLIWGKNIIDCMNKYLAFQMTICLSLLIIILIGVTFLREPVI